MNFLYRVLQLVLFALPSALFIGLVHSAKLSKANCSRVKTSLARWRDIILYAVIADFLLLTAYVVVTKPTEPGKEPSKDGSSSPIGTLAELRTYLTNTLGNWFDWALLALALFATYRFLCHIRAFGRGRGLFAYFKYPPLTLSIWIAPLFVYLLLNTLAVPKALTWLKDIFGPTEISIGALIFFSINLLFYSWRKSSPEHIRILAAPRSHHDSRWSDDELLKWIHEEKPCEHDSILFDQQNEAARLIRIFHQKDSDNPIGKRIALEGPRGIGKSTIADKLKDWLYDENFIYGYTDNPHQHDNDATKIILTPGKWVAVVIDAWGRDQSSIEEQVLGLIIEELSNHADTFSLRNLPRVYSDAIKSLEGPLRLLDAFAPEYSADDQLDKLHSIFDLLDLNLLLVIEDPDRNYNAQTLNQLTSLIDRFNPSKHRRFNTLINYSFSELTEKIGSKRQNIGERSEDKATELDALDRICEQKMTLGPVNCTNEITRLIKIWEKRANDYGIITAYKKSYPLKEAASRQIRTPREFKAIMRHADRLWKEDILLGEIDLADSTPKCIIH